MNNYLKDNIEAITHNIKELNELHKDLTDVKKHIKIEEQNYIDVLINIFHTETSNIRMSYFFDNNIKSLTNAIKLLTNLTTINLSQQEEFILEEYLNSYKSCYMSLKNEYGIYFKNAFKLELSDIIGESNVIPIWDGVFTNESNFKKFYEYKKNHILDIYIDYSYLYQRMLKEKFIYSIKHKEFINWLSRFELIKDHEYHKLNEKGGFMSLHKSTSIQRTNNFNIVFEI
jgi:hypothetical protein